MAAEWAGGGGQPGSRGISSGGQEPSLIVGCWRGPEQADWVQARWEALGPSTLAIRALKTLMVEVEVWQECPRVRLGLSSDKGHFKNRKTGT